MSPGTVRLVIDSRLEEVRRVRKAVHRMGADAPFTAEEWQQVKTCVGEAVNNAIIHAYGREAGHEVEVEIRLETDRVVCTVADRGKPVPAEAHEKPSLEISPREVEDLPEGGMGLFIIHEVMDRIEYESKEGRNVLIMTKFARRGDDAGK
jgi:anti-sigma regulatory factor (Ser/Thr protein kinase)